MFSAFTPKIMAQQSTIDWTPTFHHDLAHTGYTTSTGPLTNQSLWIFPTSNSIEYCSPAVVDGVVYVGSQDSNFYALDAANGSRIWSYTAAGPIKSSASISNGVIYFGSRDHDVYALNADNGSLKWNFVTGNEVYGTLQRLVPCILLLQLQTASSILGQGTRFTP